LAEVSSTITAEGLSISTYSGHENGTGFMMKYFILDPGGSSASVLMSKMQEVDGVTDVSLGCALPVNSIDSQEWW